MAGQLLGHSVAHSAVGQWMMWKIYHYVSMLFHRQHLRDRLSVTAHTVRLLCPQTLLSSSPPFFIVAAQPRLLLTLYGVHLSALWPIRFLDTSLLEVPWARARPEVSVRGATGWLVTRGKGFRHRERERGKLKNIPTERKRKDCQEVSV